MRRRISTLLATLCVGACCPTAGGDVIVVNDTDGTVTFAIEGVDTTEVDTGKLGILRTEPGTHQVTVTAADGRELRKVEVATRVDAAQLTHADPSSCIAVVDYSEQFRDEKGPITILTISGPDTAGELELRQLSHLYGPNDPIPSEAYVGTIIRRATRFPCELRERSAEMENHLARLP